MTASICAASTPAPRAESMAALTPAPRSKQIFRREGEYWTVAFDGALCRLKHTRGMQHMARLLSRPGERIAAVALVSQGTSPDDEAAAERARVNVTRQISAVLKRIAAYHPALAEHLASTVHTGLSCSYTPDSRLPTRWEI
ncbi:MAG: hypothetical protein HY270_00490 [Deltaproteobacteria bacterium]|nr:hypothetical protein [Deltaproteobacteria bacterium]